MKRVKFLTNVRDEDNLSVVYKEGAVKSFTNDRAERFFAHKVAEETTDPETKDEEGQKELKDGYSTKEEKHATEETKAENQG